MWISNFYIWFAFAWTLLPLFTQPVSGLLQYTAAELVWVRGHLSDPPLVTLRFHLDVVLLSPDPSEVYPLWVSLELSAQQVKIKPSLLDYYLSSAKEIHLVCISLCISQPKSANPSAKHYSTSVSFTAQHRFSHEQTTFCLIETWQQPTDFSQLHHATPPGFVSISQPRSSSRGGGLATICHENGKPCLSLLSANSNALWGGVAPSMQCKLSEPTPTNIATVYCPPDLTMIF